jgi:hypothetical protein
MKQSSINWFRAGLLMLIFGFFRCSSYKACQDFPKSFRSIDEAETRLNAQECEANFDSLSLPTGGEVRKALFYTCDKYLGYLLIHTPDKKILYRNIPFQYWKNMTRAKSFEKYFVQNVKYKFPVYLESKLHP